MFCHCGGSYNYKHKGKVIDKWRHRTGWTLSDGETCNYMSVQIRTQTPCRRKVSKNYGALCRSFKVTAVFVCVCVRVADKPLKNSCFAAKVWWRGSYAPSFFLKDSDVCMRACAYVSGVSLEREHFCLFKCHCVCVCTCVCGVWWLAKRVEINWKSGENSLHFLGRLVTVCWIQVRIKSRGEVQRNFHVSDLLPSVLLFKLFSINYGGGVGVLAQ